MWCLSFQFIYSKYFMHFYCDSSKVRCGWSAWLPCKACSTTGSSAHDWSSSQVASRWASSCITNKRLLMHHWNALKTHLLLLYVPITKEQNIMLTSLHPRIAYDNECYGDFLAEIPYLKYTFTLIDRTALCLWPWTRNMMLQCKPLNYWHWSYSEYPPLFLNGISLHSF